MAYFHGMNKRKSYFEGWYFKNQNDTEQISFIPAFHIDERGKMSASIQVIMNTSSYQLLYPIEDFAVSVKKLGIRIGKNHFSQEGVLLDIKSDRIQVQGQLHYSKLVPLKYDIMGPYQYIPFMQCRHSVFSLAHNVRGKLIVNDKELCFQQGLGYIEGDRGREFPSDYLWTQCSWRNQGNHAIMLSVATIPMGVFSFTGCIGVIYYRGKEYRFATYLGVKILRLNEKELWVKQGIYDLKIKLIEENSHPLLAPIKGTMKRSVHESIESRVHYQFKINDTIIFDFIGRGSFERGIPPLL